MLRNLSIWNFVLLCCAIRTCSARTRIEFRNRAYYNIAVALDSETPTGECDQLIKSIKAVLTEASSLLYSENVTNAKAFFGSVDIVLPQSCVATVVDAGILQDWDDITNYDTADVKITSRHPFAKKLPWTNQYKPCGEGADTIFIPPTFLTSNTFTLTQKSQIFLHEWIKFRYGAYEEYGYFGDKAYPACYTQRGNLHFTTCAADNLDSVHHNESDLSKCQEAVNANLETLIANISDPSLMAFPHSLSKPKLCVGDHNVLAVTKQNLYCDRKSVSEVVFSHADFTSTVLSNRTEGRRHSSNEERQLPSEPMFQIVNFVRKAPPGFVFLIEDKSIPDQVQMRHVKQAISQMLFPMSATCAVTMIRFSDTVGPIMPTRPTLLGTDEDKETFLAELSDVLSSLSSANNSKNVKSIQLENVFTDTFAFLRGHTTNNHQIILFSTQPRTELEMIPVIDTVKQSNYALTVFTFNADKDVKAWLQWNTIPNTKNVYFLPIFSRVGSINAKITSLISDGLNEILKEFDQLRTLEKILEIEVNDTQKSFEFNPPRNDMSLFATLSTFSSMNQVSLRSPSGITCAFEPLYKYEFMKTLNRMTPGCRIFESGTWILSLPGASSSTTHMFQIYVDNDPESGGPVAGRSLAISGSIGQSYSKTVDPNSIVPVFAQVTTKSYIPVVAASVALKMYVAGDESNSAPTSIQLLDDGFYPDVTGNDGVYSGYLKGYSTTKATSHLGEIQVKTIGGTTKSIGTIGPPEAALLSPLMSEKCCGSTLKIVNSINMGTFFHTALLPGFVTSESKNSTLQPSKIQSVTVELTDSVAVTLSFAAPAANLDEGKVSYYELCCTVDSNKEPSMCLAVDNSNGQCQPEEPRFLQTCNVSRQLVSMFGDDTIENGETAFYCGLRGAVNDSPESRAALSPFVEISAYYQRASTDKCETISDGCLPMAVFWGLIGCIGGLVLIILLVLISWCCISRRSQARKKAIVKEVKRKEPYTLSGDIKPYNVYVNRAYIQETDGNLKLVASDGELVPFDNEQSSTSDYKRVTVNRDTGRSEDVVLRRRSISNMDSALNTIDSKKRVSWNNETIAPPVYVPPPPPPPPPPEVSFPGSMNRNLSRSHEDIIISPVPRDRQQKPGYNYANPGNMSRVPLPALAGNRNGSPSPTGSGPIYASVTRNGRRFYSQGVEDGAMQTFGKQQSNGKPPIMTIFQNRSESSEDRQQRPQSAYPYPNNSESSRRLNTPNRPHSVGASPSTFRPKPIRMDAFPSSDSDSFSDMSHLIGPSVTPPPPPTMPGTSPTSSTFSTRTNISTPSRQIPVPPPVSTKPVLSRTPPADYDDEIEYTPRRNGPPPPPRKDQYYEERSTDTKQMHRGQSDQSQKLHSSAAPSTNTTSRTVAIIDPEDYDDDSEHWDDDEEYNPGVSYA